MSTTTKTKGADQAAETPPRSELAIAVQKRGISEAQWRTLTSSLYPGADPFSVLLVWDYCAARKLDPMKRPCHIVPMEVKDARTGQYSWRDVVMPGVYELRTTAMRTGLYLGHSEPEFGPEIEAFGVKAPEWCSMTFRRWSTVAERAIEFPVRVYFREVVATKRDKESRTERANQRWTRAPLQMLTKCTEAAGLREAFPDELAGMIASEEAGGESAVVDIGEERPRGAAPVREPKSTTSAPARATAAQLSEISAALSKSGIPENELLAKLGVAALDEILFDQFAEATAWIRSVSP